MYWLLVWKKPLKLLLLTFQRTTPYGGLGRSGWSPLWTFRF